MSEKYGIEKGSIFPIGTHDRHGSFWSLGTLWISANFQLLGITTGIITTAYKGFALPLKWAFLGIIIGNLIGAIFMALHSAQGVELGISQMQQAKGQFGSHGSLFILFIVLIVFMGFLSSIIVTCVQGLNAIDNQLSRYILEEMILLTFFTAIISIWGYDLIHKYARFVAYFGGASFIIIAAMLIYYTSTGIVNLEAHRQVTPATFFGVFGMAAIWQIGFAPYVSDYSRYLPKSTKNRRSFWASYVGTSIGAILSMCLGAVIGLISTGGDGYGAFISIFGIPGVIFLFIWTAAGIEGAVLQVYCASLTSMTIYFSFFNSIKKIIFMRSTFTVLIVSLCATISYLGMNTFVNKYMNFITFMIYFLVPWSAINLVDYYVIKNGNYNLEDFYKKQGGVYGKYNIIGLVCYFIGFIVEIPFMSNPVYTGIIAKHLGGADISWLVCFPIVGLVYYIANKYKESQWRFRFSFLKKAFGLKGE